jgi:undecaprenyl-diphosphatase
MNIFRSRKYAQGAWWGIFLLAAGVFLKMTWELHEDTNLDAIDQNILVFIAKFRTPWLNGAAVDITALGSPTVITLITFIGIVCLILRKDRFAATYLFIGSAGAGIATYSIKHLFTRPRPSLVPRLVEVSGFSYPSGHSLSATALYLILMVLTWRSYESSRSRAVITSLTLLIIFLICFSRLYLGVHFPSDVLSGLLFGTAWICLLTALSSSRLKRTTLS